MLWNWKVWYKNVDTIDFGRYMFLNKDRKDGEAEKLKTNRFKHRKWWVGGYNTYGGWCLFI